MKMYKESMGWRFEFGENERTVWRRYLENENDVEPIIDMISLIHNEHGEDYDRITGIIIPFGKVKATFGWTDITDKITHIVKKSVTVVLELDGEEIKNFDIK